jgi:hypothetical protein
VKPLSPKQREKLIEFYRAVVPRGLLPGDSDMTLLMAAAYAGMYREIHPALFAANFRIPYEDMQEAMEWIVAASIKGNTDPGGQN